MQVGSAYVSIKPDTSGFRGELSRRLKPLVETVERQLKGVKVGVDADTRAAQRALNVLTRQTRDLERSDPTVNVNAETSRARSRLEALSAQIRAYNGRKAEATVDVDAAGAVAGAKAASAAMDDASRSARRLSSDGGDLDGGLRQLAGGFGALAAAQALLKTPAVIEGVTASIGAVTALGGAAVATTAALTPLVGILPVLGAGGLAVGQGFGVAKLATLGLSDALKDAAKSDEAVDKARRKLNEATREYGAGSTQARSAAKSLNDALGEQGRVFDDLSPAAARFGRLLLDLKAKGRDLRDVAAEGFFPGAEKGLRALSDGLLPTFRTAVGNTGKVLGDLAEQGGKVLGSPFFAGRFAEIAARNDGILRSLGGAAINLAAPLTRLVGAAGPLASRYADLVNRGSSMLDSFIAQKEASGGLDRAFATIGRTLGTVGGIVRNVGGTLRTVFTEAFPAGQQYLGMLLDATGRMRELARSGADSGALGSFFTSTIPLVRELAGVVTDATRGLGGIGASVIPQLTPILALIRSELLPSVLNLVSTLDGEFLTALVRLASSGADFLSTFATATPILTGLTNGLAAVLGGAVALVDALGPLGPLLVNTVAAFSLFKGTVAAFRVAGMIGDFVALRTGVTGLGKAASGAPGLLSRMGAGLASVAGPAGALAATIFTLDSTFKQIAPSVDKTAQAFIAGKKGPEEFAEAARELAEPSLGGRLKTMFAGMFDPTPPKVWGDVSKKALDSFRQIAEATPEKASAIVTAMERSGQSTAAYRDILAELTRQQEAASTTGGVMVGSLAALAAGQQSAAWSTDALNAALDRQTSKFLEASGSEIAYQEAIDRLSDSIARNGATFDVTTAKGRENLRARDELIAVTGRQVESLVAEATQSGITQDAKAGLLRKLYELRDSGYPGARDQAQAYIDKVNAIPPERTTKINADTAQAQQAIAAIVAAFNGINGRVARIAVEVFGAERAQATLAGLRRDTGNILAGINAAPREHGGPVRRGETYIVGEKRPELFVPKTDGYIVPKVPPNATLRPAGGAGRTQVTIMPGAVVVQLDARGNPNAPAVGREVRSAARSIVTPLISALEASRG